jgi:hypothetical protein
VTGPILALRAAVLSHVAGDAALAGLMGGQVRLYDEPPRASAPVYAVFGEASAEDWSTSEGQGHSHRLSLIVWGKAGAAAGALQAAERLATLLHEAPLVLTGHRLVLIRVVRLAATRDAGTGQARVEVTLTALTEVA